MWVNPAVCQSNTDFKMKIWLQKHAKMAFNFKENVDWTWEGREELQAGVYCTHNKNLNIFANFNRHNLISESSLT